MASPSAAVVVDPYSSGRFLLYELKDQGIPIICVRSSLKLGAFFLRAYDANKEYFNETVDYEEDLPKLVEQLKALAYTVTAVFAGSEPGVQLADELAETLALPTANGTELTNARKDKAAMQERLRTCGVPAAEQLLSSSRDELLTWARNRGQWPLVAKPTGSSGSDGIFFCQGEQDVSNAVEELVGKPNPNGKINGEIVLQEFLSGTEYIVDTVSYEGKHICVAIWVYTKRRGTPWNPNCIISEGNRLMEAEGEVQDKLVDYVFSVLTAVGLRYGPCHTEVMFTPRGPVLVEVNARLHGLQGPKLIGMATGTSKAAWAVDALAGGGKLFTERYPAGGDKRYLYPLQKHCLQVVLISPVSGYLSASIKEAIGDMKLPSVVEVLPSVQKRQYLYQTCDLNTAAGYVLMVHESREQIEADVARIREAETSGELYRVSTEPEPASPASSAPRSRAGSGEVTSPRLQSVEKAAEIWSEDLELPPASDFELVGMS